MMADGDVRRHARSGSHRFLHTWSWMAHSSARAVWNWRVFRSDKKAPKCKTGFRPLSNPTALPRTRLSANAGQAGSGLAGSRSKVTWCV